MRADAAAAGGRLEPYEPTQREAPAPTGAEPRSRVCFAAAHVVADPLAGGDPTGPARLDWEATLAFRRHLWAHGLRVAEAMDTAQRGMGLDWAATQELIRRSVAEAKAVGGQLACGAGTDQIVVRHARTRCAVPTRSSSRSSRARARPRS